MKSGLFLFTSLFFILLTSFAQKTKQSQFDVLVMDVTTNQPLERAAIRFTAIIDARDIVTQNLATDSKGLCKVQFPADDKAQYLLNASKEGYLGFWDPSSAQLDRSAASFTSQPKGKVTLYLTSDLNNHESYWNQTALRLPIDSIVNLLKSDQFPEHLGLPIMQWEDIPALLAIGTSSNRISHYPSNPLSSSFGVPVPMGLTALWLIESIRLTELKQTANPAERFPSLLPRIQADNSDDEIAVSRQAYQAYVDWWMDVKKLPKAEGAKVDPLAKSGIKWF